MLEKCYIILISLLFSTLLMADTGLAENLDNIGFQMHYYNEPLLKPGLELALDYEKAIQKDHRLGIVFPSACCSIHPENNLVINIESKLSYRYFPQNRFSFEAGGGPGFYFSRKTVPVYNLQGNEIHADWNTQMSLNAYMSFSYLPGKNNRENNWRLTGTLGWKGIFPNNLSFSHHIYLKAGIRYRFKRFSPEEKA